MIPQRNLSMLSNRLAREGGRRISEAVLERDYCLSWFLVGLSHTLLTDSLAFKGGTALKKCYFADYRFSEDLDFTLTEEISFKDLRAGLDDIFTWTQRASGIPLAFDHLDRHAHGNAHTFYLSYEGPLPAQRAKTVKVDVTIREIFVYPLVARPVLRAYEEYADLPEHVSIQVYSLNEIGVEKAVSILDRARTEPRDLHDLAFLVSEGQVDLAAAHNEIVKKLAFRGVTLEDVAGALAAKESRYRRLWQARLADQMAELPEFDGALRTVRRAFREAGLA
jgi:hypothetical protein